MAANMNKFNMIILASIAMTFSFASLPAHAAKDPDGMEIKLVPAKKYHGKLPKHAPGDKIVKMKVVKRQSITMRGAKVPVAFDAKSAKPVVPSQTMEKISAPSRPAATTIAKADITEDLPTSQQKNLLHPIRHVKTARIAKKSVVKTAVVSKTIATKPTQAIAANDTVSGSTTKAEPDLADSLERLPITPATSVAPAESSLTTNLAKSDDSASGFKPVLQFKNRLTLGRKYELETIGGKNFFRKHELFVGGKSASGWGAAVSGGVWATSYADSSQDQSAALDTTLLLYHPAWYKDAGWDVGGFARIYFPTSDSSRAANQMQYLYLLYSNYDFGGGFKLENTLIPHYFTKDQFADSDAFFYLEEEILAKQELAKWVTLEFGPYLQVESHERTAPGTTLEMEPGVIFNIGEHAFFESKMYLPIYVDGVLGGGARSASLSDSAGEFVLKLWY